MIRNLDGMDSMDGVDGRVGLELWIGPWTTGTDRPSTAPRR